MQKIFRASSRCSARPNRCQKVRRFATYRNYCALSSAKEETEYAFEMASSSIRYGEGVTREVAMDLQNMDVKRVCIMTDKVVGKLPAVTTVLDAVIRQNINYAVFDGVRTEPTEKSFMEAIRFASDGQFDAFVAVGGGSVIDTCKVANLYSTNPDADFFDYVDPPIGRGKPVTHKLNPLIAIPTTAGTGSETTGVAIFDYEPLGVKTGIRSRVIRPLIGLIDPLNVMTMPGNVAAYSGFDVLCHALESFTAVPYTERVPRPLDPKYRPAYQGSNPISDIWSKHALALTAKYFRRSIKNEDDKEARSQMQLASSYAGIGFGNAGVHLCHAMSYPISGKVKTFMPKHYQVDHPLVPHGLSVVITAPAVFGFTSSACPERHLEGAQLLGADTTNVKLVDAGRLLSDTIRQYMYDIGIEDGLSALGYTTADIPELVRGTMTQHRIVKLSPRLPTEDDLASMLAESMKLY